MKQNSLARCLGFNINLDSHNRTLSLSKEDYVQGMLQEFSDYIKDIPFQSTPLPETCHLTRDQCPKTDEDKEFMSQFPFRRIIGKLNYYTISLRVDINFAVNYLARFMDNPGKTHWDHLLLILAYIRDFPYCSITYRDPRNIWFSVDGQLIQMQPNRLYCFVDADFASSDSDNRRSVTGYIIFFNGAPIAWRSVLQRRTSSSTTEAEYRALHEACKECIWLSHILNELEYPHCEPILIFEDNTSTIAAVQNPVAHSKLKHMDTIFHQVKDFVEDDKVKILHIETANQLADLLTKSLTASTHHCLTNSVINILPAKALIHP
jgi:hypothetical protein